VPGAGDVPAVGHAVRPGQEVPCSKRELVILLKPTVIPSDKQWEQNDLERDRRAHPGSSAREP
jgi:MSHA biogenesis protein MshL